MSAHGDERSSEWPPSDRGEEDEERFKPFEPFEGPILDDYIDHSSCTKVAFDLPSSKNVRSIGRNQAVQER